MNAYTDKKIVQSQRRTEKEKEREMKKTKASERREPERGMTRANEEEVHE